MCILQALTLNEPQELMGSKSLLADIMVGLLITSARPELIWQRKNTIDGKAMVKQVPRSKLREFTPFRGSWDGSLESVLGRGLVDEALKLSGADQRSPEGANGFDESTGYRPANGNGGESE